MTVRFENAEEFVEVMEGFFRHFDIRPKGYCHGNVNSTKKHALAHYRECMARMYDAFFDQDDSS